MFRRDDYNNNIIKELINNTPNIIIHEHDFVTISLQGQQKPKSVICLTCGSFYSEKSGKLIASVTRSNKTAISANSLCN